MAAEEGVEQAVELLPGVFDTVVHDWFDAVKRPKYRGCWAIMSAKEQLLWAYRFREEELGVSRATRREYALKIACAAMEASRFDLQPTTADDLGKTLGRFALAVADKILE